MSLQPSAPHRPRSPELLAGLAAIGERIARGSRSGGPVVLSGTPDSPSDEFVLQVGDVVVKAHPAGADRAALAARLSVTADPRLHGVFLAPLPLATAPPPDRATPGDALTVFHGRLVTGWPAGVPVCPDTPEDAPWEQSARLLARLHTGPTPPDLPAMGGPARVARAVTRLRQATAAGEVPGGLRCAASEVLRAYATLPVWAAGRGGPAPGAPALVHGDWHLGQVVYHAEGWLLIDVDTLGIGDPAWDLARPAAWYATGVLPEAVWQRFLTAYLEAGGSATSRKDPWSTLEVPARAITVQTAATALVRALSGSDDLDDMDRAMLDGCARIAAIVPPAGMPALGRL